MKKQMFISLFVVFLLFLISFIFAFFSYENREKNKKPLLVKYNSSQVIYFTNKLPISDALGKKIDNKDVESDIYGYVDLLIKNPNYFSVEYDIYLTKNNIRYNPIKDEYIKFYVTNSKDVPYSGYEKNKIPSYGELLYLSDEPNSRLLYHGFLNKNSSTSFKIRSWLSDSYVIANNTEEISVDVKVRIK